jgi:hypothetical protein
MQGYKLLGMTIMDVLERRRAAKALRLLSVNSRLDALSRNRPRSRHGRRAITAWQEEAAVQQLKAIAFEQNWTQQRAVAEALNLLFAKHGKPTVA